MKPIVERYTNELKRAKDSASTRGNLNTVLELEPLLADAEKGIVKAPPDKAGPTLQTAYTTYERNRAAALRPIIARHQKLEQGYKNAMNVLEQRFTRSGQLDAAKLARDAKEVAPGSGAEVITSMSGAELQGDDGIRSELTFRPPVEIEWRFETDSQVRVSYACDQLIFNFGDNTDELRIDGGPVSQQHQKTGGRAPTGRPISVKMTVLPKRMSVSLDGRERGRWTGDFSTIDQAVGIRAAGGSKVKVDKVIVRKLKQ
jgi:hypothetical protein